MILDAFAGLGGWDIAARELDLDPIGLELDADACATRAAVGLSTIRCSVPEFTYPLLVDGLIASPPCQAFSSAGTGDGRRMLARLHRHAYGCLDGWYPWAGPPELGLVLEPLRLALECRPVWITLEQVPPVLELWLTFAEVLSAHGWQCWAGVLNSADYGVPQTRKRAILLAHRDRQPWPPEPTHCRGGSSTLFGELAPWVSMAEALGWGFDSSPSPTVTAGGTENGGVEPFANADQRARLRQLALDTAQSDAWATRARPADEPAPTIRAQSAAWTFGEGRDHSARRGGWQFGQERPNAAQRAVEVEPSPTLTTNYHDWRFRLDRRQNGAPVLNPEAVPSPTLTAQALGAGVWQASEGDTVIRLTLEDALRLQTFPADYPVAGGKAARFRQVGNAIPPLLARAILGAVSD